MKGPNNHLKADTQLLLKKMDQNFELEISPSMRQKGHSILQVSKGKKDLEGPNKRGNWTFHKLKRTFAISQDEKGSGSKTNKKRDIIKIYKD